jgi:hypothetical protein
MRPEIIASPVIDPPLRLLCCGRQVYPIRALKKIIYFQVEL